MFDALKGIFCFVTVSVSFIYGTRIAWCCGRKCHFKAPPEERRHSLFESIPAAAVVYLFGFLILFGKGTGELLTTIVASLTCAILLAALVVSVAMPEFKRRPDDGTAAESKQPHDGDRPAG